MDDGTEIEDGRHMIVLNSQYRDANVSHQIKDVYKRQVLALQTADMMASKLLEGDDGNRFGSATEPVE